MMLSTGDAAERFERAVAETLRELHQFPGAKLPRRVLTALTADSVDDVTVFDPMIRSLRSDEAGQR